MKKTETWHSTTRGTARAVSLCSVTNPIDIAGELFVPDKATAYVEFYLSHAFPVYLDVPDPSGLPEKVAIHPQVVANSYRSLKGKVVNLAHLMVANNPESNPRDRIMGCVMAVEFPEAPEGGWKVQADPALAPGIRVVASLFKNAEGVPTVLDTWAQGKTPFSDTQWTVSMENESRLSAGGFLVKAAGKPVLDGWAATTPADLAALGWIYVPYPDASQELKGCMKPWPSFGIQKDFNGCETMFLNGGLDGTILYCGVALVPLGKESAARVVRMEASATGAAAIEIAEQAKDFCGALNAFADAWLAKK